MDRGDGKLGLRRAGTVRKNKFGDVEYIRAQDFSFDCEFGEDGKRMVWGAVDSLYEKHKPKF